MQSLLQVDLLQVSGITPGRAAALLSAGVGLISVIIGRLALIRAGRRINSGRVMGIIALVVGLISIVLSLLHLASTTGGFGTGTGRAGAIVAVGVRQQQNQRPQHHTDCAQHGPPISAVAKLRCLPRCPPEPMTSARLSSAR